ncbi:MAG TPA: sigma-70 family RNA polymerase sigma factor [Terriglobales bacterium]
MKCDASAFKKGEARCYMQGKPDSPPVWLLSAQKIENAELRAEVAGAADRTWRRWVESSESRGGEAIDAIAALDYAVGAAIAAERTTGVRNTEAYVFKAFWRKARKLLSRERRLDYRDPSDLADLKTDDNASFVQKLEQGIQVEELMALMDERMRTIFVMDCRGFPRRETARVLGMSEDAVRKAFARGVDRLRRLTSTRAKS